MFFCCWQLRIRHQKRHSCDVIKVLLILDDFDKHAFNFSDCTPPFNVGVRTSNEFRGIPPVPVANINGQKWDQEVETIQARGVCLNYKQTPCA